MPEEKSLAMELLQDCKAKDKRNFVIIIVLIVAFIGYVVADKINDYNVSVQHNNTIKTINKSWQDYLSQYTFEGTQTITIDGKDENAIYQNKDGEVNLNGKNHN